MEIYSFMSLQKPRDYIYLDIRALIMPLRFSIKLIVPFVTGSRIHFQTDFPHIPGIITTASTSLTLGL